MAYAEELARAERENEQLRQENRDLRARLDRLEGSNTRYERVEDRSETLARVDPDTVKRALGATEVATARTFTASESLDNEAMHQAFKSRLMAEVPALIRLLTTSAELEVTVSRKTLTLDEFSLKGRLARLLKEGFFKEPKSCGSVRGALKRTGPDAHTANIGRALDEFTRDGFVTKEGGGYQEGAGMKVNIVEG